MRFVLDPWVALNLLAGSAVATAVLILVLKPFLIRYALARPNARSSHTTPTPQGGGIAIILTVLTVLAASAIGGMPGVNGPWVACTLAAVAGLALVGALDDIRPMPVAPRLLLQITAAAALVMVLPSGARLAPPVPHSIEQGLMVLALVWFINLTNFMDGIDWMTVSEATPVCCALALLGIGGFVPALGNVLPLVLAILGGMLGFAPFNRHVAKLFLGDVGSLPLGAIIGWLLLLLAVSGYTAAAIILPLYYLADATITLVRRLVRGEKIWQAHRSHFYQIATTRGFNIPEITTRVLLLNILLAMLAFLTVIARSPMTQYVTLGVAAIATGLVLLEFSRGRRQ